MTSAQATGHGRLAPTVLLLPGGVAASADAFRVLATGLRADPGCPVVTHDRPGTGTSDREGALSAAPAHVARLVEELGCGPVVVVGQSLGGAVALLLAAEHPGAVAGLVLLDPTPIDDPRACRRLEAVLAVRARLARWRRGGPDAARLHGAVRGLGRLSGAFSPERLPQVPAVVVTADRDPRDPMARSHTRVAAALGAPVVRWAGAGHDVHLSHPEATLAVVRELLTGIRSRR